MLRRSLLLSSIPLLISCGGGSEGEEDLNFVPQTVGDEVLGWIPAGTYVIRSDQDAQALARASLNPELPVAGARPPSIDYARFVLVVVSYGLRGQCDDAEVVSVKRRAGTVFVEHRKVEPAARPILCGFRLSAWTAFATLPVTSGPIEFVQLPARVLPPP